MHSVVIFDIKRFAVHDGPGIRTTVFMKGCPLDCWWCHNPESRSREPQQVVYLRKLGEKEVESKKTYGKSVTVKELMTEILKDKLFFEESDGGVTFSGGEPLYQPEALLELLRQCKSHGLHTAVDTCGHTQWKNLEQIVPYTDIFLYDLKMTNAEKHREYTGTSNELILENLQKLLQMKAHVELRIPVIPGINDSAEEIRELAGFLKVCKKQIQKIHLLHYHRIAESKYRKLNLENRMKKVNGSSEADILDIKTRLEAIGCEVGIGG